jgi:hypothetical protein
MNDDETILHAPCGHGNCRICWEGLVLTALQDTSTTKVKTGATDLLDVSKLKCPGCTCVTHKPRQELVFVVSLNPQIFI